MGITEILTIIFVILKLIGKIDWSWFIVLLPEIIGVTIYAILSIFTVINGIKIKKKADKIINKTFEDLTNERG